MFSPRSRVGAKKFICIGLLTLIASGCSSTSPRSSYYLLSGVSNVTAVDLVETIEGGVILGIGPILLPEYTNRPQVVTRTNRNEITFSEFHRWAEPLINNFRRVFKENLAMLVKTDDIFMYPWPQGMAIEYIITADVIRFDAVPDDRAILEVRWSLWRGNDRELLANLKSSFQTPLQSSKHDGLVAAMSACLSEFSHEVANAVVQYYHSDHQN
jgi:uncharacterized lipoprotein YmbA